jgi:hypothetical protein
MGLRVFVGESNSRPSRWWGASAADAIRAVRVNAGRDLNSVPFAFLLFAFLCKFRGFVLLNGMQIQRR